MLGDTVIYKLDSTKLEIEVSGYGWTKCQVWVCLYMFMKKDNGRSWLKIQKEGVDIESQNPDDYISGLI